MSATGWSRRTFIARMLSLPAAIAALRLPALEVMPSETRVLAERLVTTLGSRESAAVIGRWYLEREPARANAAALVETLDLGSEAIQHDPNQLLALVNAKQRDDFAVGSVVNVDGWLLSKTEARLCALAALLDQQPRR